MASIFILFSQPFNTDVDESPVSAFYNVSSIVSVFATVLIEAIIIFACIFFFTHLNWSLTSPPSNSL